MAEARWRRLVAGSALAFALVAASAWAMAQVNPLPPDKAFRFSARLIDAQTVEARFRIAEGYYLYRDKIHFAIEPAAGGLAVPRLPDGKVKDDPFFGHVETYRGDVVVNLGLKDAKPGQLIVIAAESQGCADIGICYPPTVQRATVALPEGSVVPAAPTRNATSSWFD